jgi:hypothetical protein
MDAFQVVEALLNAFLILALDGGEWSVSSLEPIIAREGAPGGPIS